MAKSDIPGNNICSEVLAYKYLDPNIKLISSPELQNIITLRGTKITKEILIACLIYLCDKDILPSDTALEKEGNITLVSPIIKKKWGLERL